MANPQLEDGRTEIANELVDQFARLNLKAYEWRVLWAIIRKTYGWHKKSDAISLSQLQEITGLHTQHISRTLVTLKDKNLIISDGFVKIKSQNVRVYQLQKDYSKWSTTSLGTTSLGNTFKGSGTTSLGNAGTTSLGGHKSTYTKAPYKSKRDKNNQEVSNGESTEKYPRNTGIPGNRPAGAFADIV